jgi:hypothetical protein
MYRPLLTLVAVLSTATPVVASPNGFAQSSSQDSTNSQTNEGTIIQAPSGGSQTNINQNNSFNSTYGFGIGINCPTPSLGLGVFSGISGSSSSGFTSDASTLGGSIAIVIPFGGSVGAACRKLASEIARQRVLDTQVTLIKTCIEFKELGVVIDTTKMPEFEVCNNIAFLDNTN